MVPKIIWIFAYKPSLYIRFFAHKYVLLNKVYIVALQMLNRNRLGFYAKIQIIFGTVDIELLRIRCW